MLNSVNKTLYIPLFGKAFVSKKGIILSDEKAEEIWQSCGFALSGKAKSKWLAYYMAMRSATFDEWTKAKIAQRDNPVVLHLGCGLDARAIRVGTEGTTWFDVDFNSVIAERKKFFAENENYKMVCTDLKDERFVGELPRAKRAVVIMEGVSMYLSNEQLQNLFCALCNHFENLDVLVDCYTSFGAKMSKIKNPVKDVGVSTVYGIDSPTVFETDTCLKFVREHSLTPKQYVDQLKGLERFVFRTLYAGKIAKKLYKLYEFES